MRQSWPPDRLGPFRAADAIEASGLDYTILHAAWLTDNDEVDYELTACGEPLKGTVVSHKSVADLIVRMIVSPQLHLHANVGVNKPSTDGDKHGWRPPPRERGAQPTRSPFAPGQSASLHKVG